MTEYAFSFSLEIQALPRTSLAQWMKQALGLWTVEAY